VAADVSHTKGDRLLSTRIKGFFNYHTVAVLSTIGEKIAEKNQPDGSDRQKLPGIFGRLTDRTATFIP